jgi:hypothetical protein
MIWATVKHYDFQCRHPTQNLIKINYVIRKMRLLRDINRKKKDEGKHSVYTSLVAEGAYEVPLNRSTDFLIRKTIGVG